MSVGDHRSFDNGKLTPSERRDAIIEVLCKRRKDNVKNLAHEFNISRRTIISDILELTRSYPIETYRVNGGCVKVADGYYMGRKYLNLMQITTLHTAIESAERDMIFGLESILREFSL